MIVYLLKAFLYSRRRNIDKLGIFHANLASICLDPHKKIRMSLVP